jgi:uncharacterized protein (TIGR03086 family)
MADHATLVALFRRNADQFGRRVDAIGDDQWTAPTPCSEWDVRTLVNHVVGEQLWAPPLMGGQTIADVGDRYDGDVLGSDPKATWRNAIAPSIESFAAPGALDGTVHLSYGDEAAAEYLVQMVTDLAVHGWDLARAIGADETIDPETATLLWESWSPREDMIRGSGVFGDKVDTPADADAATRLLGLMGRNP